MRCRRQYPGGTEGLVVPGGGVPSGDVEAEKFGTCGLEATRFFAFLETSPGSLTLSQDGPNAVYATCEYHARDTVAIPYPFEEVSRDEAEVFMVMKS